jgi:spermidine synthase
MALDDTWFTEPCEECGSAFSLKIKRKLHEEQSPFQKIEIYETETFGNLMVIDGFVMLSDRDNFVYHEMMSHPALFTHDKPEKVVIVGGGDCGTLREVLRHPQVAEAWQVEIDERVTRVSEQYFPTLTESNNDARAHFHFGDAIEWIKGADAETIDVIVVDSTDPIGPAAGLFAEPFYRDCLRALRPGGIVVQQSESPLFHMNIIKPMHKSMRAAGFADTRTLHFFQCSYPSGWWTATMARKEEMLDSFREADVNNRTFATRYYNADIHRAAQAAPEFFKRELGKHS